MVFFQSINIHTAVFAIYKYYLPRVTKKQKRLSTMVSIIASISVSIISGLLIAERRSGVLSASSAILLHLLKGEMCMLNSSI